MDGGASGHLRHDVECAAVVIYSKPAFIFLLANGVAKAILHKLVNTYAFSLTICPLSTHITFEL